MRRTLMCPKCGYVDCPQENYHENDICHYCNTKKIQIDFSGDEVYNTPFAEFDMLEQKINRKFLFQLPTFDEEAYEARIKETKEINAKSKREYNNLPRCPICNSVNLSKISAASKVGKIAMFGIFGMGDNGKTWKCNNCGSKF
ncbi:MAG: hypothetical protein RSD08_08205 [Oscillospiraceae bacterium]